MSNNTLLCRTTAVPYMRASELVGILNGHIKDGIDPVVCVHDLVGTFGQCQFTELLYNDEDKQHGLLLGGYGDYIARQSGLYDACAVSPK